jgi:hypothetical protein
MGRKKPPPKQKKKYVFGDVKPALKTIASGGGAGCAASAACVC